MRRKLDKERTDNLQPDRIHTDKEKEENNCVNSLCCRLKPCPFIIYSSSSRNSVVDTIKKEKSCVHHIAVSKDWKNEIIFCITNEISSTIISLSSSDKLFLESGFFIRNYYYITNYHWNLLRFTLYIRS